MRQSSTTISNTLAEQFRAAGIRVKRGVRVTAEYGQYRTPQQTGSDIWLYRWARNSYRNAPLVWDSKGVRFLANAGQGCPAVVVGIGPSLDDDVVELRKATGKAIVIATDAAFRPLLANGIRPDLVISFDCKPEQGTLWERVPPHDVPILFDTCSHPSAISSWQGPVLFYNHFHYSDELSKVILPNVFPDVGQIPSGGTVGNMALLLTKILGCSPVLAVGMDFCYGSVGTDSLVRSTQGWRYRSKDYHYINSRWEVRESSPLYDNDDRVSRSFLKIFRETTYRMDPELVYYHTSFINLLEQFKITAINCSVKGALKDAIPTMPLADAVDQHCNADIRSGPFHTRLSELRRPYP